MTWTDAREIEVRAAASRIGADEREAVKVVRFFTEYLTHTKGKYANQPFELYPWQRDEIVIPLFATLRPDGKRQYSTAYVEIGRKNGKSELGAGVALQGLFADGEYGAEIYSVAKDKDQASLVFNVAAQMVRNSPRLMKMAKVIDSQKRIIAPKTGGVYRVIPGDAPGAHGLNPSRILFDELHTQPSRELWDVMATGTAVREQPLLYAMTTAGYDRHSICWEQHAHALSLLKLRYPEVYADFEHPVATMDDPSYFARIWAVPPLLAAGDGWQDRRLWAIANPALGTFKRLSYMEDQELRARMMPANLNRFLRLELSMWTTQVTRWIPMGSWDQCGKPVDSESLRGRPCYGGLDLASTGDIAAFILVFPPIDEGEDFKVLAFFWIPADNIENRVRADQVPYDTWRDAGLLTATEGNVIHYAAIRRTIQELGSQYRIVDIGYDAKFQGEGMAQDLESDGFEVVPFGQNSFANFSPPSKELERQVTSNGLAHGGNPILRWMADNVMIESDSWGNIKPSKKKSTEKIDGIVALIMAFDRAMRNEGQSVYEARGIDYI